MEGEIRIVVKTNQQFSLNKINILHFITIQRKRISDNTFFYPDANIATLMCLMGVLDLISVMGLFLSADNISFALLVGLSGEEEGRIIFKFFGRNG